MNNSPWSACGRGPSSDGDGPASDQSDPTFGAARELMLTQQQLRNYLARTLHEYNEIRAGRAGYVQIVSEALKPSPKPETIEERLRRLSRAQASARGSRGDPSPKV